MGVSQKSANLNKPDGEKYFLQKLFSWNILEKSWSFKSVVLTVKKILVLKQPGRGAGWPDFSFFLYFLDLILEACSSLASFKLLKVEHSV